jgi:hypothetical protein
MACLARNPIVLAPPPPHHHTIKNILVRKRPLDIHHIFSYSPLFNICGAQNSNAEKAAQGKRKDNFSLKIISYCFSFKSSLKLCNENLQVPNVHRKFP